jgi:hypothetical protein
MKPSADMALLGIEMSLRLFARTLCYVIWTMVEFMGTKIALLDSYFSK